MITGLMAGSIIFLSIFDNASLALSPVCTSVLERGIECPSCGGKSQNLVWPIYNCGNCDFEYGDFTYNERSENRITIKSREIL